MSVSGLAEEFGGIVLERVDDGDRPDPVAVL
jgi:hypothetical protein